MKRRIFLIIDGYNLMHAAGIARQTYGPGDLERSRNRFLAQLSSLLSDAASESCTVVFDAFDASSVPRAGPEHSAPMHVMFAAPGQDADSEIEELVRTHSAPRQILLVSSDHRLHKAARRRRAKCVDSEVFWSNLTDSEILSRRRKPTPVAEKIDPPQLSDPTVDPYQSEFLQIDVDQIQRDLRQEDRRDTRRT